MDSLVSNELSQWFIAKAMQRLQLDIILWSFVKDVIIRRKMLNLLYTCKKFRTPFVWMWWSRNKIWEEIQNIVIKAFNINLTIDKLCVLAGVLEEYKKCKLMNILLSITRLEIWKRRNINRHENVLIPIDVPMYWIKYQIKQHVQQIPIIIIIIVYFPKNYTWHFHHQHKHSQGMHK